MKQYHNARRIFAAALGAFLIVSNAAAVVPAVSAAEAVVINEVCTKNSTLAAPDGQFYDYVELYNTTGSPVSIGGWTLSDDPADPARYRIPDGISVPANGFYVIYCGVVEGTEGAAFGLSKDGETLTLSNADGAAAETVEVPALASDNAYGRIPDGGEQFGILSQLSPGSGNHAEQATVTVKAPEFSKESGFYNDSFELMLTAPEGCTVYYTLDGSDPTVSSERYNQPIRVYDRTSEANVYSAVTDIAEGYRAPSRPVDKAMIVRAAAVDANGNISEIITKSYFIGYAQNDYAMNMRVISLVTDPDNLFDREKGIYVRGKVYEDWRSDPSADHSLQSWEQPGNYTQSGMEWERPANITVFENGQAAYNANIGIRMHGGATRSASQKSFKLYARLDYGTRKMEYDFFNGELKNIKGKVIDSFDKLMLRNGGNDDKAKVRDRLNQEMVEDRAFGTQKQTECVVFIDGEFWGTYNIVEKIGKEYIADHYKVKEDSVCMIKTDELEDGTSQGFADYEALKALANSGNFGDAAFYESFCKLVDIDSYTQYMAAEFFIGNSDFGDNNYALWKTESVDDTKQYADGKWRFLMFDTEYGQGLYNQSNSSTSTFDTLRRKDCWMSKLFFGLFDANDAFREAFTRAYFDLCNENYRSDRVLQRLTELQELYTPSMIDTYTRFAYSSGGWGFPDWGGQGQNGSNTALNNEFNTIRSFWQERASRAGQLLVSASRNKVSGETIRVTVNNSAEQGTVGFNTLVLGCENGAWSGSYPKNLPLTLNAEPKEGYAFSEWKVTGADYAEGNAQTASAVIVPGGGEVTVEAVYVLDEQQPTDPPETDTPETDPPETDTPETDPPQIENKLLLGDADCSGEVDVSDAVMIARFATEDRDCKITEQGKMNADVNFNKQVDLDDGTLVLQFVAKLILDFQ
ncbi:MAG: CotH kinase family protein [Oscillospiraceae bacterium]|nr:CotH kinase family protein [Oscillospiraceae bacterium]